MNAFLLYAITVIGVPNYVGAIAGGVFMPFAWRFDYPARLAVIQLLNFPKGILAMLVAHGIFRLLGVPTHWMVLAISIAWISIYYASYKQPRLGWISFVTGQVVGWILPAVFLS
jgi:hypothetical protein